MWSWTANWKGWPEVGLNLEWYISELGAAEVNEEQVVYWVVLGSGFVMEVKVESDLDEVKVGWDV